VPIEFVDTSKTFDPLWVEHGYGNRFQGFQNLMRLRIRDILLVSSLYDLYLFEEDGRLYELIRNEYEGFNLSHAPELTRVSNGADAIQLAKEERRFDLIITTMHIDDMHAIDFARLVKKSGLNIPIVLLAYDNRELKDLLLHDAAAIFDRIAIWQGDFRIIITVVKSLEDRLNVDHDTKLVGVQVVMVVEDNIKQYSSILPSIYTEILKQSQHLISEGINLTHKFLRMRARPKILLATTFEEAWRDYEAHKEHMLGVITDIDFPRKGVQDPEAGLELVRRIKDDQPDLPILMLSNLVENRSQAHVLGTSFVLKDSPLFLNELRQFMVQYFSFGDFVFRTPDGVEVGRASDLKMLEEQLEIVPDDSIVYHGERNHFSNWLKARTEFWLAHQLRPRKVSDYPDASALRQDLIQSLHQYRNTRQRGIIADFTKESFDPESSFARVGGGSLGGKARGLGFVNTLINDYGVRDRFEHTRILVPCAIVIGTDVFDEFVDDNDLREFAINCQDDTEITRRFLEAPTFPETVLGDLAAFLDIVRTPLAVRSSSLLEDSQYHPFAGVYETYMIPNQHGNPLIRLNDLLNSIKRVYASTFYQSAKAYIGVTSYRLEEEKMAVIVQKMAGTKHEDRFYPDFSGVAKSYNFYPYPPARPEDGIVSAALGLGKMVVDGGNTVRFCPRFPTDLIQFYSTEESLNSSQREFYALELNADWGVGFETHDVLVKTHPIEIAEEDATLRFVGSTYSPENDTITDGLGRSGIRVVTFGPILRQKIYPLAEIVELLLDMGTWGMGTPIEIEFAVRLSAPEGQPGEFSLLQLRPLVVLREPEELVVGDDDPQDIICRSTKVLGHGRIEDIRDIVVVDYHLFDRSKSRDVAQEVSHFNKELIAARRPYLLIGVGRWGSLDPWLGIPVTWEQIAGAKAIVETSFKEIAVTPSQGSHFFQNITSFMVGYFSVGQNDRQNFVDWDWLLTQDARQSLTFTRLIRFDDPLTIKINGHQGIGVVLKPGEHHERR
jgi:CheY-like chemotaxis protein